MSASRALLRLRSGYEFLVPPLTIPLPYQPVPPDDLTRYGAIALFCRRAQASQPDFQLAEQLFISLHTTQSHVRNILSKLHAENRRQAARLAARRGLLGEMAKSVKVRSRN